MFVGSSPSVFFGGKNWIQTGSHCQAFARRESGKLLDMEKRTRQAAQNFKEAYGLATWKPKTVLGNIFEGVQDVIS